MHCNCYMLYTLRFYKCMGKEHSSHCPTDFSLNDGQKIENSSSTKYLHSLCLCLNCCCYNKTNSSYVPVEYMLSPCLIHGYAYTLVTGVSSSYS